MYMQNKMKIAEVQRLSDELKQRAIKFGLCELGKQEWGHHYSLDSLIQKYVDGIEFILDHPDFMPDTFLIEKAGRAKLHAHGIYIDENVEVGNPYQLVINGCCHGHITASGFSAPEIYLRGKSDIVIDITDGAIVHINMYDNATLGIHCSQFAKCFVYKHGGYVKYEGEGKVLVRDKVKR